jgi:hypothetical protein
LNDARALIAMNEPAKEILLTPPQGAVRFRRFLANASRKLVLYPLLLLPLAIPAGIFLNGGAAILCVLAVPLCWALAMGLAIARTLVPTFVRFSLKGLLILVWSGAFCITLLVSGAQNDLGWLALIGFFGFLAWGITVLIMVIRREQKFAWPDD